MLIQVHVHRMQLLLKISTCMYMHTNYILFTHITPHPSPTLHPTTPTGVFRVVSGVLHFGNMQFKQERSSDQALLTDNTVAQKIAKLFGISVTDFTKALLKPKIKTGREFTVKSQTKAQVEFSCQALAKAMYERLFKWIVARINKSLDRSLRTGSSFIGILDIAGFEIFKVHTLTRVCGPLGVRETEEIEN